LKILSIYEAHSFSKKQKMSLINLFFSLLLITITCAYGARDIVGSGASFPAPLYKAWARAYTEETGESIVYQPTGSSEGVKQILQKSIDFGASDKPLTQTELNAKGILQFPTLMGGVVVAFHLSGTKTLKLTPEILSEIFLGKITAWNDKKIQDANPSSKLPAQKITVVHRVEGSGTTFLFTSYLSSVSPEWAKTVGADSKVSWPKGMAAKGNEDLADFISLIEGSIGYLESSYATKKGLSTAHLRNKDGFFVEATMENFIATTKDTATHPENQYLINLKGPTSWPIMGATYVLIRKDDKNTLTTVLDFFRWAFENGDTSALDMGYVPLPLEAKKSIQKEWP